MTLQFDRSEIPTLIQQYTSRYSSKDERALNAGERALSGDYSKGNLLGIIRWKSPRRVGSFNINEDSEVKCCLESALKTPSAREFISFLTDLRGIGLPMASSIMAMCFPKKFTVIDVLALRALGVTKYRQSAGYYLSYLEKCKALSADNNVSLRDMDRALWQWGKNASGS